jgi:hypothetical protein
LTNEVIIGTGVVVLTLDAVVEAFWEEVFVRRNFLLEGALSNFC